MRQIQDGAGRTWEVLAVESVGAHNKMGAVLGFRPADQPATEPLTTPIVFNSKEAADFAITTMSEAELRRRLSMAQAVAGMR